MALGSFQFINEDFFRWARPHKGFWRDVLFVRRSRKPAENAARREKDHLWMETIYEPMAKGPCETTYGAKCEWRQVMEDRWLSVDDIAAYLGIKRDTVYRWISERNMPGHKIGRLWKFRKEEVDEWVKRGGSEDHLQDDSARAENR